MCKYCDDGKTIGTVLGTVAVEDGQICLVSASIWKTIVGNIKYCPMCGKELSSKTLKELEKENKILEKKAIKYKEEEENEKDEYEEDEEW
jgi:hypothetical protein